MKIYQQWEKVIEGERFVMRSAREADRERMIEITESAGWIKKGDVNEGLFQEEFRKGILGRNAVVIADSRRVVSFRVYKSSLLFGWSFTDNSEGEKYKRKGFFKALVLFMIYRGGGTSWEFDIRSANPQDAILHGLREIEKLCGLKFYRLDTGKLLLRNELRIRPLSRMTRRCYKVLKKNFGWRPLE